MSNFGNKRCAWIYERYQRKFHIKNGMIVESVSLKDCNYKRDQKNPENYRTIDGRKFHAISYIGDPDSNGVCSKIIPYHEFLGEVYEINNVEK